MGGFGQNFATTDNVIDSIPGDKREMRTITRTHDNMYRSSGKSVSGQKLIPQNLATTDTEASGWTFCCCFYFDGEKNRAGKPVILQPGIFSFVFKEGTNSIAG